ncbi:hypothetical protein IJT93_01405 [bacterium]|nr:hypothetical protein [bacterium]
MRFINRNIVIMLALVLACLWGGANRAFADEEGYEREAEVCRNLAADFLRDMKEGRSVWNYLSSASKESFIQLFLETMKEDGEEIPLSDNSIRAILEIELADENSELSQIVWKGLAECFEGVELPDDSSFEVQVNGREAYVFVNEDDVLKLFYEGRGWKVGIFESFSESEQENAEQ